jgi:hypothetical protein
MYQIQERITVYAERKMISIENNVAIDPSDAIGL